MVHGAAVGDGLGGALLTARGGSGKSTTALHCVQAGMRYAGDDTVLVGRDRRAYEIHSLYNSARLARLQLETEFSGPRAPSDVLAAASDAKATVLLGRSHAAQLTPRLPLDVLLIPRIAESGRTCLRPVTLVEAMAALAPSSLLMVPGAGARDLERLTDVARATPRYVLDLGLDPAENVAAVHDAIRAHRGP